jgi:hypothetical protein
MKISREERKDERQARKDQEVLGLIFEVRKRTEFMTLSILLIY